MSAFQDVNIAREKLMEALGEKSKQYIQGMKAWFQMKSTKEEFDAEARKLLDPGQVHFHNQFLLQLLIKCSREGHPPPPAAAAPPPARRSKTKDQRRRPRPHNGGFQATDVHEFVPARLEPRGSAGPGADEAGCAQELLLPDVQLVHMRLMLAAWEFGLAGAEQSAADVVVHAVQFFLKNVLTAILSRRNGFRVRENRIQYAIGVPVANPWLRNTAELLGNTTDEPALETDSEGEAVPRGAGGPASALHQQDIALAYAAAADCPPKQPVTAADCFDALQVHKSVVASHGVYSLSMERILSQIYHPSWEEMGE